MGDIAAAAYGLRLAGLEGERWLAVTDAAAWPVVRVERDAAPDAAEVAIDPDGRWVRIRADVPYGDLVHPLLGRIGGAFALAAGRDGLHAGALTGRHGAWAVIGAKGSGKSTLLAALAAAGTPILADDVLLFGGGVALAGPRCVDLRPDADRFGASVPVRASDPRRRIGLPPVGAEHPLAGVLHLEWSAEDVAIEPLPVAEALAGLNAARDQSGFPADPRRVLDLLGLPTYRLRRPRSWDALGATVVAVRELVGHPDAVHPRGQRA